MNSQGGWNLDRWDGYFCRGTGFKSNFEGQRTSISTGTSDAIAESTSPGHAKIVVRGSTIQIWVNDDLIANLQDPSESPIDCGGIGFLWRYESMGWIRNVRVTRVPANPGEVPVRLGAVEPVTSELEAVFDVGTAESPRVQNY